MTTPYVMQARPPLIEFEYMAVEDRDETIKAGYLQYRNEPMAIIRQAGSHDTVTKPVDEMLKKLFKDGHEGRCPLDWHKHYEAAFQAWKEGNEIPPFGTPVITCLMLTPAEQKMLIQAGIRTLEDAADMSEQALGMVGMGAREIKEKAKVAISSASKLGEENMRLKVELDSLKAELAKMQEAIVQLGDKRSKK